MEPIKLVVRYNDGKMIKGYTSNFHQNRPIFHVKPKDEDPNVKPIAVNIKDLKAVFFVKDFDGNPSYDENKYYREDDRPQGKKIEVKFKDGEVMVGSTVGYDATRQGFFLFPADSQSNNLRVFVVAEAVDKIRFLS